MADTASNSDPAANGLNPAAEKVARVYAQAILEAADRKGCRDEVLEERLVAGRMQPTTSHALHVLARHGRLGIVAEVADAARRLANELAGRHEAVLTTAVALSEDDQQQVIADVERKLGVPLAATFAVDPALIGGLVVRVGDTVYDQSIASSLASLGGKLHRRTINEIQHGRDRLTSA
ncbi:ATP synthase F1 subunit delta [bacterium]|nr:ATP synthase F1 subunit delta [bacterium]